MSMYKIELNEVRCCCSSLQYMVLLYLTDPPCRLKTCRRTSLRWAASYHRLPSHMGGLLLAEANCAVLVVKQPVAQLHTREMSASYALYVVPVAVQQSEQTRCGTSPLGTWHPAASPTGPDNVDTLRSINKPTNQSTCTCM